MPRSYLAIALRIAGQVRLAASAPPIAAGMLAALTGSMAQAQDVAPLHVRIDQLISQQPAGTAAPVADDLTYLRRATLDLVGRIPSVSEARAFMADTDPDKRVKLVDRLMATPDFTRNLATVFDVMLMERRGGSHVSSDDLRSWLRTQFEQQRPYNEIVQDLLAADGTEEKQRAASAFYLERDAEPHLMTREVGRMFFGVDLQCAQCHDHPLIEDYTQTDYFGLFAFVSRTSVFRPDAKKPALLAETSSGVAQFKSVFTAREGMTTPRLPDLAEGVEPAMLPGEDYVVAPAKDVRSVPKFSRREQLARLAGSGDSSLFNRNIANRLWAAMMGRGLVHPVDHHHSGNPATYPQVLDALSAELHSNGYQIQPILRELALTQAYQRAFELPEPTAQSVEQAAAELPQLASRSEVVQQQLSDAENDATAKLEALDAALAAARPVQTEAQKTLTAAQGAATKRDEAAAAQAAKQSALDGQKTALAPVAAALTAVQSAAQAVPEDADIKAALATFQKKSDALTAAVTKAQGELDAAIKATADTEEKLKAANEAYMPMRDQLAPLEDAVRARRAEYVQVMNAVRELRGQRTSISQRTKWLETLVAVRGAEQQLPALQTGAQTARAAADEAATKLASAQQAMTVATAAFETATKAVAASESMLTQTQAVLATRQKTLTLVAGSLQQAAESLKLLPGDAGLTQAVANLQTVSTRTESEAKTLSEQATVQTQALATAQSQRAAAEKTLATATGELAAAQKLAEESKASADQTATQLAAAETTIADGAPLLTDRAASGFNVAVLEPLTPEQLGWSMLEASGHTERLRASEAARINKEKPLSEADQQDAAKVAAREREIDEATSVAISKQVAGFTGLFASQKGQPQDEFFATVDQALFLANGGQVLGWLSPSGSNLTGRMSAHTEAAAVAEELYLTVLTRQPDAQEIQSVAAYLDQRKDDRPAAMQELAWALMTSAEFRFSH